MSDPVDTITRAICREKCAFKGEPPCWSLPGEFPPPLCSEPGCKAEAEAAHAATGQSFQSRVHPWMHACFGPVIAADQRERNHRFFEESAELVQAKGMTREEAHMLVDYVFSRPVGEPKQEVGGVMVTLAALCLAAGLDMHAAGETELTRVWSKIDIIREKQRNKPRNSPLPE